MSANNVTIQASSQVVYNYPTAYTFTIFNNNPIPAYGYLVLQLPAELTMQSSNSIGCTFGGAAISCTFNPVTYTLTFSYLQSTTIATGQLSTTPIILNNIINPSSTANTGFFSVWLYNSLNNQIEYTVNSLTYKLATATSFYSLNAVVNNTVNSALTTLTVSFNIPMPLYINNSLLVITFPAVMSTNLQTS